MTLDTVFRMVARKATEFNNGLPPGPQVYAAVSVTYGKHGSVRITLRNTATQAEAHESFTVWDAEVRESCHGDFDGDYLDALIRNLGREVAGGSPDPVYVR